MVSGFGFINDEINTARVPDAHLSSTVNQVRSETQELGRQLNRLMLLNQALWELLQERVGLSETDLINKIREVDLRDGVEDGKFTARAVRCPRCERVCNSRHSKCIYCGQEFQVDLFGTPGR